MNSYEYDDNNTCENCGSEVDIEGNSLCDTCNWEYEQAGWENERTSEAEANIMTQNRVTRRDFPAFTTHPISVRSRNIVVPKGAHIYVTEIITADSRRLIGECNRDGRDISFPLQPGDYEVYA